MSKCHIVGNHMSQPKSEPLKSCPDPDDGTGGWDEAIGFLINTGPDSMENHTATKSALIVGPPSVHQRSVILMAFCWWADDVPLLVVFEFSLPSSTNKKNHQSLTPIDKTFWIRTWK